MNELLIDEAKLNTLQNEAKFINDVIRQIRKDFAKFNLELQSFSHIPSLSELTNAVNECVIEFMTKQTKRLPEFMYTIDIPEKLFNELLESQAFYEDLSMMLIKREAMKVYLRSQFSK